MRYLINQVANQLMRYLIYSVINQVVNQAINQEINQVVNQAINQEINQLISQPINQPIRNLKINLSQRDQAKKNLPGRKISNPPKISLVQKINLQIRSLMNQLLLLKNLQQTILLKSQKTTKVLLQVAHLMLPNQQTKKIESQRVFHQVKISLHRKTNLKSQCLMRIFYPLKIVKSNKHLMMNQNLVESQRSQLMMKTFCHLRIERLKNHLMTSLNLDANPENRLMMKKTFCQLKIGRLKKSLMTNQDLEENQENQSMMMKILLFPLKKEKSKNLYTTLRLT